MRVVAVVLLMGLFGCDHFKKPTSAECKAGVSNLMQYAIGDALDKEFPTKGEGAGDVIGKMAKSFGKGFLTEVAVDDQKVAWCELNMSKHEANCLRAAQSKTSVQKCGIKVDNDGNLTK